MAVISVGRREDEAWVVGGPFFREVLSVIDHATLTPADLDELQNSEIMKFLILESEYLEPGQGERLGRAVLDAARRLREAVPPITSPARRSYLMSSRPCSIDGSAHTVLERRSLRWRTSSARGLLRHDAAA